MLMDVLFSDMTQVERWAWPRATDQRLSETRAWIDCGFLCLITAPNTDVFGDALQHIGSFTTAQDVEACMVSESIRDAALQSTLGTV